MTAEELNKKLHEKPKSTKEEVKRARRTAIVLAASTVIAILFFVYAFIKKTEADAQRELALKLQMELQEVKEQAEQEKQKAKMQQMVAMEARHEAEKQRAMSEQNAVQSGSNNQIIEQLKKELEAQRKIAEQNLVIAMRNEKQAIQMQHLAHQNELAAKKALEDCQQKKQ
ncbi:MAG TPA: hypothetical protein VFM90_03800 [Cyclobacteriaceae bacterium]|nr:hypothetical protein [Cyclobacteriaceae bacterium]